MNQAKLWKVEGEEHYFVAVPDQHYTNWMNKTAFEQLAYFPVPPRTNFTKCPNSHSQSSRGDLVEGLREQLEYWELQMYGEVAKEWNYADKRGGGGDIEKYERYKQRVICCSIFLKALQENPLTTNTQILREEKVETSKYILEDNTNKDGESR